MIATNKEAIRNFDGTIIGWLETDDRGNGQIRDFYGTILGTYDADLNVTRDFYGTIKSKGNTLTMLLR